MNKTDQIIIKHIVVSAVSIITIWIGALNVAYHVSFATMMLVFTLAMIVSCVIMTHNILLHEAAERIEGE